MPSFRRPLVRGSTQDSPSRSTRAESHTTRKPEPATHALQNPELTALPHSARDLRLLQHLAGNRAVADLVRGSRTASISSQAGLQPIGRSRAWLARASVPRDVIRRQGGLGEGLLRQGSTGPLVEELQRLLNAAGAEPPLQVDGAFGPATLAAVMDFQRAHGLDPDGIVGPLTSAQLYSFGPRAEGDAAQAAVAANIEGAESPMDEYERGLPQARAAYAAGRYEEALAFYERFYSLPELAEKHTTMTWNVAIANFRLGRREQAIAMFQEYLLLDIAEDMRNLALEYIRIARTGEEMPPPGQPPSEATPEQRAAADAIANAEIELGDAALYAESIPEARDHYWAAYSQGAASADNRAYATVQLGVCHQWLREFDRAIDFYQESLGSPVTDEERRLAVVELIRQCRLGQVGREEPPTPITAEQADVIESAAIDAFQAGQYEVALAGFQSIYQNPDAPVIGRQRAAYWSGECHQRLRQFDQAIAMYEEFLLFPGIEEADREMAAARIQQCRNGELGAHVQPGEPAEEALPGAPEVLFAAQVYFETGSAEVGGTGYSTILEASSLLSEQHRAHPGMVFEIEVVGGASRRWRGAGSTEEARRLNEILSGQRADAAQRQLEDLLPPEDVEAGVYPIDARANGDELSEVMGIDPDDNTWTLRDVAILAWGTRTGLPAAE